MAAGVIGLVGRLRAAHGPDAADAELLRAYSRAGDAEAFAALVRRHGPMVWATCVRTVGDRHAAEDAFQATFLVLTRKAGGLRPAHSLGGWLHAVAVHVSVRARTAADRRKRRRQVPPDEVAAPNPPEPPDERALATLDEEVERLPAKLREAVVLCELEGLSRRDAAARLGVPEGTLSSRLAAARKRLADRLRARGVTPELLAVPAVAVPAGLAEAAGVLAAGGVPAPAVAALAGGTMTAMLLKGLGVGLVACGLLAAGGRAVEEPPAKPAEPPKAEAIVPGSADPPAAPADRPRANSLRPAPAATTQPAPAAPASAIPRGILVRTQRRPLLLDPAGGSPQEVPDAGGLHPARSPDGRWVLGTHPVWEKDARPVRWEMLLRRTDDPTFLARIALPPELATAPPAVRWEPAGTALVRQGRLEPADPSGLMTRFDPATQAFRPVPADTPFGHPSPDGRRVAVLTPVPAHNPSQPSYRLAIQPAAGGEPVAATSADRDVSQCGGFSPDGGRLLFVDRKPGGRVYPHSDRVCVVNLATKTVTVLAELTTRVELSEPLADWAVLNPGQPRPVRIFSIPPGSGDGLMFRSMVTDGDEVGGLCWSPDGKRVAYSRNRMRWEGNAGNALRGAVVVCDANGRTPREVFAEERMSVWLSDWR